MKKILFVATEPAAGMVTFASSIINCFHNANYDVWAITVSLSNCPYNTALDIGNKHIDFAFPNTAWGKLKHKVFPIDLYKQIINIADNNNISNIHFLTGEYGFAPFFSKKLNKKYNTIYTVHDLEPHPIVSKRISKNRLFRLFFHKMTLLNLRFIDNIVSCSKTQCSLIQAMFPEKKVLYHVFPSLVTKVIANGTEKCPELVDIGKYILFFGYVGFHKGIHVLYNAFLDSKLVCEYKLVIAGRGSIYFDRREDERNIIRINRFIKDEELADLYKGASFVVYPYMQATMSGVLTIAHHFNRCCITSDLPYFQENVTLNDVMSKRGDSYDLKNKMEEMADSNREFIPYDDANLFVTQLEKIYK